MSTHLDLVRAALTKAIEAHGGPNGFTSAWLAEIEGAGITAEQINRAGRRYGTVYVRTSEGGGWGATYSRGSWDVKGATFA